MKDDISNKLSLLPLDKVEGQAKVLETFQINGKRNKVLVAGCRVQSGRLSVNTLVKVLRNGEEVYRGKVVNLKHHKEELASTDQGKECGIRVEDSDFIFEPDDIISSVVVHYSTSPKSQDGIQDFKRQGRSRRKLQLK